MKTQHCRRNMGNIQLLFIVVCAVASSLACSCMKEHPQKLFCNADFGKSCNLSDLML